MVENVAVVWRCLVGRRPAGFQAPRKMTPKPYLAQLASSSATPSLSRLARSPISKSRQEQDGELVVTPVLDTVMLNAVPMLAGYRHRQAPRQEGAKDRPQERGSVPALARQGTCFATLSESYRTHPCVSCTASWRGVQIPSSTRSYKLLRSDKKLLLNYAL